MKHIAAAQELLPGIPSARLLPQVSLQPTAGQYLRRYRPASGQSYWCWAHIQKGYSYYSSQCDLVQVKDGFCTGSRTRLKFWVIPAKTPDEHLAAATLRAQLFYEYPANLSSSNLNEIDSARQKAAHEYQLQDLLKKRIQSEHERDSKMESLGMNVKCLLAVCERAEHEALLGQDGQRHRVERSTFSIPPEITRRQPDLLQSKGELVAIGTLDVQDGSGTHPSVDSNEVLFQLYMLALQTRSATKVGKSLPGEYLEGAHPTTSRAATRIAYVFNLCILKAARRRGVATTLMEEALLVARAMRISVLYVHVEAINSSAIALYKGLGYVVEQEESVSVEKRLERPRRLLLSFLVT
eukprot:SM000097S24823  [mRNA]  locus=s97:488529:490473:- [translate_table: standard]